MKYIVYQTINLTNNKIYIGVHKCMNPDIFDGYIGCGVVITSPSSYLNPYTPFQYAVKKHGVSKFRRTILSIFDSAEEAYELEKNIVNRDFIKRNDVYNAKPGGFSGSSYSVVVNQFNKKGIFLKQWDAIIDASDFYHISHTAVSNAIKFKSCCKDFFWSTDSKIDINEYSHNIDSNPIMCYQYNLDGKLINIYNSILETSKDNKVTPALIRRAIYGGYRVNEYYYSEKIYENYTGESKVSINKGPVYVYSLNGDFIIQLNNSKEIYDFLKVKTKNVITTSLRTKKPYKEYQFSLEKVEKMIAVINFRNISKKVGKYSLTGNLIEEFDSATSAVKKYGTSVNRVLKGQQKQCKNFIFKYI